jgi:hypothetical protein
MQQRQGLRARSTEEEKQGLLIAIKAAARVVYKTKAGGGALKAKKLVKIIPIKIPRN